MHVLWVLARLLADVFALFGYFQYNLHYDEQAVHAGFIMIFIFHTSGPNTLRQFSKVILFAAENHSSTAFCTKVDLFSFAKN